MAAPGFPRWAQIVGVAFAAVTLLFFMGLVLLSIFVSDVPVGARFLVVAVLAISAASSFAFWGGDAAAKGQIPIPFVKNHPVEFSVGGGIAVFVIVLLLGWTLYVRQAPTAPVVAGTVLGQRFLDDPVAPLESATITFDVVDQGGFVTTSTNEVGFFSHEFSGGPGPGDSVDLTIALPCYVSRRLTVTLPETGLEETLGGDVKFVQGFLELTERSLQGVEGLTFALEQPELKDFYIEEEKLGCSWQEAFEAIARDAAYDCLDIRAEPTEIRVGLAVEASALVDTASAEASRSKYACP